MFYPGARRRRPPGILAGRRDIPHPCGVLPDSGRGSDRFVDAGLGPSSIRFPRDIAAAAGLTDPPESIAAGGLLPGALATAGVAPADITTVFLTHLHADHIGWIAPGGALFRPNAVVMCGAVEWETPPIAPAPARARGQDGACGRRGRGVLRPIDAATVELAPGVSAHHSPGHTPGHYVVRVS